MVLGKPTTTAEAHELLIEAHRKRLRVQDGTTHWANHEFDLAWADAMEQAAQEFLALKEPAEFGTGKQALRWTRLSCRAFRANAVRLQLFALAYNLANFLRTLALPDEVARWTLTTLREKLIKIGARIVRHGRYVVFQLAEVAVPRALFAEMLRRIDRLRPRPPPLPA